jgi:hypothetical protein
MSTRPVTARPVEVATAIGDSPTDSADAFNPSYCAPAVLVFINPYLTPPLTNAIWSLYVASTEDDLSIESAVPAILDTMVLVVAPLTAILVKLPAAPVRFPLALSVPVTATPVLVTATTVVAPESNERFPELSAVVTTPPPDVVIAAIVEAIGYSFVILFNFIKQPTAGLREQ